MWKTDFYFFTVNASISLWWIKHKIRDSGIIELEVMVDTKISGAYSRCSISIEMHHRELVKRSKIYGRPKILMSR